MDVERGQRERATAHAALRRLGHSPFVDYAHVARSAAHVEAQHLALAGCLAEHQRPADAPGGAREHSQRRMGGGSARVGEPARGLHHLDLRQALLGSTLAEFAQVGGEQGGEGRVNLGGTCTLVLPESANKLVRERQMHVRQA